MAKWKASEWTDIKELMPLQFMPSVAKLFREVTGKELQCLGQFTGWIGQGGYYHWRVVKQGLIHLVPHLQGQPTPRTPNAHPSGRPLPPRRGQPVEPLGSDRTGPNQPPVEVDKDPPQTRVDSHPPPARVESHPLPARAVNWPPQVEVGYQQPRKVLLTLPQVGEEQVIVPGPTGTK